MCAQFNMNTDKYTCLSCVQNQLLSESEAAETLWFLIIETVVAFGGRTKTCSSVATISDVPITKQNKITQQ